MRWVICLLALATSAMAGSPLRIVSIGGAATETVFELGAGELVVGVDTSSIFPAEANRLPQVGYQRALTAEGVASLKPDLVILASTAGPSGAIEQLLRLGIPVLRLQGGYSIAATAARVRQVGQALGREKEAEEICRKIDSDAAAIQPSAGSAPRVLFVMSAGSGTAMAAGEGTAADAVIRLVGAKNVGGKFSGYKQLSPEALVALDPEVVATTSRTLQAAGSSLEALLPGLALTSAGKLGRLIVMDDLYLLGFGPRAGKALAEFSRAIDASPRNPGP